MTKNTILVIDDNLVDLKLSTLMLEKNGFTVIGINSSSTCMELLITKKIDIVLLDIMMPEEDGIQTLAKIREKYNQIELPIIMVTSKTDASNIINTLQSGANDYITKPVHYEIATRRIHTHLMVAKLSHELAKSKELETINSAISIYNHELNNPLTICLGKLSTLKRKHSLEPEIIDLENALWRISETLKKTAQFLEIDMNLATPNDFSSASSITKISKSQKIKLINILQTLNGFDLKELLDVFEEDPRALVEILVGFQIHHANIFIEIKISLEENNLELAKILVHKLKGTSRNIGAVLLSKAATALDQELKTGQIEKNSINALREAFQTINESIDLLKSEN